MDQQKSEIREKNINKDNNKIDILARLPSHQAQMIYMYCTPNDIFNVSKSSNIWKKQMDDEHFWKWQCKKNSFIPNENSLIYKKLAKKHAYWHGIFLYYQKLEDNWKRNIFQEIDVKEKIKNNCIFYFDDEVLIASGTGKDILIVSSSNGKLIKKFTVEDRDQIKTIKKWKDLIICLTTSKIVVINITTLKIRSVIKFKPAEHIFQFNVYQNIVCLLSINCEYIIINIDTQIRHVIRKEPYLKSLQIFDNTAVILTYGKFSLVTLMNLQTYSKVHFNFPERFFGIHNLIKMVLLKDKYLICLDSHLRVSTWNYKTSNMIILFNILDVGGIACNMQLIDENKFVYYGKPASLVHVYNFLTGELLSKINNNLEFICAVINNHHIVTFGIENSSRSKSDQLSLVKVKMWCLKTEELTRDVTIGSTLRKNCGSHFCIPFTKTKLLKQWHYDHDDNSGWYKILNFDESITTLP